MKLSIIIPVYNEEYFFAEVIHRVMLVGLPPGMEREIIIVDDASSDDTPSLIDEIILNHPEIRRTRHNVNLGKGAAIRTGVELATGDIILIQDADLEYDPSEYPRLLQPILNGDADVVFGSRFLPSSYRRVLFFRHSLANKLLTFLSNLFTDLNLTDMETGYKVVRAQILKSIPIRCKRFGIEPELTAKLAKRKCRIYEVPISYRGRTYEEGKKITWWDGVKALGAILRFWIVDDIYDDLYGHSILQQLSRTHRFNRWTVDVIRPWIGNRVLEIGAGLGNITQSLLPRRFYVASDIDALHLEYLKNRFSDRPGLLIRKIDVEDEKDFEDLPEVPDTIICSNVLEHLDNDEAAIKNMCKVLAPGGRVCLVVPHLPSLFGSFDRTLQHRRRYVKSDIVQKLTSQGLEVETAFSFNRICAPAWWLNSVLLRRKKFGRVQLKIFDTLTWLWRSIDPLLPIPGLSLVVIAQKSSSALSPGSRSSTDG